MSKLSALKNIGTDRAKVMAWLSHINEFCQEIIDEVIDACVKDPEARKYFVARHDEDILNIYQPQLHLIENAA